MQSKKMLWAIVTICLVTVVAAAGLLFYFQKKHKAEPTLKEYRDNVDTAKLPDNFPSGLPMETGAKIIDNYNLRLEDGRTQATRTFETSKTLDQNVALYKDFFNKNGWKLLVEAVNEPLIKTLFATKDSYRVKVAINESMDTHVRTVNITVTPNPFVVPAK